MDVALFILKYKASNFRIDYFLHVHSCYWFYISIFVAFFYSDYSSFGTVLNHLNFAERTTWPNCPPNNGTTAPLPRFDWCFKHIYGNCLMSNSSFLSFSNYWTEQYSSYCLVNRIIRTAKLSLHSRSGSVIYRFGFSVTAVLSSLSQHTYRHCFHGAENRK